MSGQIFIQKKAQIKVRLAALGERFWGRFTLRGILSRWARKLNVAFTLASLPVAVGFRTWGTTVYCCPSKAAIYCGISASYSHPSPVGAPSEASRPRTIERCCTWNMDTGLFGARSEGRKGTCSDIASCNRTKTRDDVLVKQKLWLLLLCCFICILSSHRLPYLVGALCLYFSIQIVFSSVPCWPEALRKAPK